jgi:uncharacterized protein (TIGR02270 family)
VAGESLSMITGVDVDYADLDRAPPEHFTAGPTEEPADSVVTPDPDERLPWPDPAKVEAWWASETHRFPSGRRYLFRTPIDVEACERAWAEGYQRQRRAAAFEFARLRPKEGLRSWRVKVRRL